MIKLIQDYEIENRLAKESSILLISSNQEQNEIIQVFFSKNLNFKKVKTALIDDTRLEDNIQNADLIMFNSLKVTVDTDKVKTLLSKFDNYNNCFVYFGLFNANLAGFKNMNFANSEFTIYARIMETLKIQEVIKRSNKN